MAGQLSMVQWLLGLSCNADAADAQGQTALIAAAAHGHQHVVSCLLDASCDALATNSSIQSALHVAAATCSKALLSLLLPHRCAAPQQLLPLPLRRPRAADVLFSGALLNAADINGHSPLLLSLYSKVHRHMMLNPSYCKPLLLQTPLIATPNFTEFSTRRMRDRPQRKRILPLPVPFPSPPTPLSDHFTARCSRARSRAAAAGRCTGQRRGGRQRQC